MSLEGIDEIELSEQKKIYVNNATFGLFEALLNEVKGEMQVGKLKIKLGTALKNSDFEQFVSGFNLWVSACLEKGVMEKTLSSNSASKVIFNSNYSEIQAWGEGLKVLKGMDL